MSKAIRYFSLALAFLMIFPLFSVFPVKVSATEQTYDDARNGELLRTVNFLSDEWNPAFADGNNDDANVAVSDDGYSVRMTVLGGSESNKRAMWGGFYSGSNDGDEIAAYNDALAAALPMEAGAIYTMVFDLTLGDDHVAFGIQVDGENTLSIQGNGQSRWYGWNTVQVGNTSVSSEKWTKHIAAGASARDTETFAVVMDYDAKTMSLYVMDADDGAFYFCRSITYTGENVWDSDYFRCRFNVRSIGGTPDETYTAEVANLNIYKGNVMNPLFGAGYRLPYWSHADGDKLLDVNFKADDWRREFATESNVGAEIVQDDEGGTSLRMTVKNESYKRAIWGGFYSASEDADEIAAYNDALATALPMEEGVKYTMIFDLTLGDDHVAFGIQVDGENTLSIQGNGQSRWYGWNTVRVGDTSDNNEKWNYHTAPGSSRRDLHTFAVVVDYDAKTMSLYVKDADDGAFYFCRSITYTGENVWDSDCFRCRFNVRSIGGTPNANYTADVANLKIYKGNALNHLWNNAYVLPYEAHSDGDALLKVDFGSDGWRRAFATSSNVGALPPTISAEGYSVSFTVLNESYKRAIWGGFYSTSDDADEIAAYNNLLGTVLPLNAGEKYTMVFDLTLGDDHVAFGIQVDGENALVIQGNGQSRWYGWNTVNVDNTTVANDKWDAHIAQGTSRRSTHTFAVVMDYDAKTMSLYVKDENDGRFYLCRSMTYDGENVWDSDYFRCRFNVRSIGGTPNENYTAEVSDLTIYKGLAPGIGKLSVMSYNIEEYNHGTSGRTHVKALETVSTKSPDIVGLQEVDKHWNGEINETLSGYTRVQGNTKCSSWPELLYKTDEFECAASNRGYVHYCDAADDFPDVSANGADMNRDGMFRMFVWALLYHKASRKTVLAISTHLHYRAGTSDTHPSSLDNALVRQYEIRLLLAWIADQSFEYDCVVVVGDMNADYTSGYGVPTISLYEEGGFALSRKTAATTGDTDSTLAEQGRTVRPEWIYDYVLTKGNVEPVYYSVVDNKIDHGGTSYPSDHLPIRAELCIY